jgi:opacity protein-like surface antigen
MVRGGYDFGLIRADMEVGYRTVDVDSVTGKTNAAGSVKFYTAMINGTIDIDVDMPVVPYISIGAGVAIIDGNVNYDKGNANNNTEKKNFGGIAPAGQIGAGLSFSLTDNVDLTGGYSMLLAPTGDGHDDEIIEMHSVLMGLNFKF